MLVSTANIQAQSMFDPILNNEIEEYVTDPQFVRNWERFYTGLDAKGNPWQKKIIDEKTGRRITNPVAPAKFVYKNYYERLINLDRVTKYKNYARPGSEEAKKRREKKSTILDQLELVPTDSIY